MGFFVREPPQYVNKVNRKLYMSVCFLLAAKFNEPKVRSYI